MRSARALGHDSHHLVDQESGCQASATENRRLVAVSRGAPIGRRPRTESGDSREASEGLVVGEES